MGYEHRQPAPAGAGDWQDQIELSAVADNRRMAFTTRLTMFHKYRRACLQICVWLDNQDPIVLCESDLSIPGRLWEVRGSGLWADHICETPHMHWSYGLEAFALAIDEPTELLARAFGERVPIGWELDFETSDLLGDNQVSVDQRGGSQYSQPGIVHGFILSALGERRFEGFGRRGRSWGEAAAPNSELTDPTTPLPNEVALPGPEHIWWVRYHDGCVSHRTTARSA